VRSAQAHSDCHHGHGEEAAQLGAGTASAQHDE